MKIFHQSLAKKQVWRQIKLFGGRFGGRDVGFKKRVAILGPVNFRSMYTLTPFSYKTIKLGLSNLYHGSQITNV